ncbi:MAG TPA: hypothetical protein VKB39_04075 [Candidatus Baltobacteraceae bacterium]|nr:hypothetical protein [Candidatus Baltobacteraceae bacterium]
MSTYKAELADAERIGQEAHDAMEEWVSRPLDAASVPGAVLEAHAKALRESRERILALLRREGVRDDLEAALARNEQLHRSLGLSVRDKPDDITE